MKRTVLITGAGGFVGSHMAEGFLAMGDVVIALDTLFDAPTRQRLGGASLIEAGLTAAVLDNWGQIDLVIHGAAITTPPRDFGLSDDEHIQANVDLLVASLDIAKRHRARDFVFLSSSGVFSLDDGEGVHLESMTPTGAIPYALAKRAGEDATAAASGSSLRAISIRLGPIYGPAEAPRSTRMVVSQVRRWLDHVAQGEPIIVDMPDERRDWTFAPDLPRALDALLRLEPKVSGVVHLTSAQVCSNLELAKAVAGLVDSAAVVVRSSSAPARLPMASDRMDLAALFVWTPLATGLAKIAALEGIR